MQKERLFSTGEGYLLDIPPYAFDPNKWTETFMSGLLKVDVTSKDILELGFGTGIMAIHLLRRNIKSYCGVDIDKRLVPIAAKNVSLNVSSENISKATFFQSDLFLHVPSELQFDIICGCLPQIEALVGVRNDNELFGAYYFATQNSSSFSEYGFSLNERALIQARKRLRPDGSLVLVLSGRFGLPILSNIFTACGYTFEQLYEDVSPIASAVELTSFVDSEQLGKEVFFYNDVICSNRITAREAEERRQQGKDAYYKIFVCEGKLNE